MIDVADQRTRHPHRQRSYVIIGFSQFLGHTTPYHLRHHFAISKIAHRRQCGIILMQN